MSPSTSVEFEDSNRMNTSDSEISDVEHKVSNNDSDLNLTKTENLVQVHCDNRAKGIQSTENRSTPGVF